MGLLMATGNLPARRKPTKSDSSSGTTRAVIRTVADGYRFVRTREPGFIAGAATGAMYTADAFLWGPTASPTLAVTGATAACMTRYWTSSPHAKRNREMRRIGQVLVTYDIKQPSGQAPRMKNFERTPAGKRVDIRLPKQMDAIVFEKLRLGLENDFQAEVRVDRIPAPRFGPVAALSSLGRSTTQKISRGSGSRPVDDRVARGGVRLMVVERDTLATPLTSTWPVLLPAADGKIAARRWWEPVPVGLDEDGQTVNFSWESTPSLLIAGESGAGKSVSTHELVSAWVLDVMAHSLLWDGKGELELVDYARLALGLTGPDPDRAVQLGELAIAELENRLAVLKSMGLKKAPKDHPDFPPLLLVVEEFTAYSKNPVFIALLQYLLVRIRAVNMRMLLTTQRPSAKVIDTDIRDNVSARWAHRMNTHSSSDMCLGPGFASNGWSAMSIPAGPSHKGVGLLLHEGGAPVRLRSWYSGDDMPARVVARALELRGADPKGLSGGAAEFLSSRPAPAAPAPSVVAAKPRPTAVSGSGPVAVEVPVVDAEAARRAHNAGQMQARRGRKRPPRAERAVAAPGALNTSSSER